VDAFANGCTHPWQKQGRRSHYRVLTPDVLCDLVQMSFPYWEEVAHEEVDSKVGNGFTLVFQVNKPAWESRPMTDEEIERLRLPEPVITVMGDGPGGYAFVPEGYAQGGYVPNAYIPEAGFFVPPVDAKQLEADAVATIDKIKAALEETPEKPKRKRKPKTV